MWWVKEKAQMYWATIVKWHQIWLYRWIDVLDNIFCKSVRYLTQISYINLKSMCKGICDLTTIILRLGKNFTSMQGLHGCIQTWSGDFCEGLTSVSRQLVLDPFDIWPTCQYQKLFTFMSVTGLTVTITVILDLTNPDYLNGWLNQTPGLYCARA